MLQGKRTVRLAAAAIMMAGLSMESAKSAECVRKVDTLKDAQDYADCLDGRIAATNKLMNDRIEALLGQIDSLKAEMAKTITVDNLQVKGTLTVDGDIRQNGIRQVSYYFIGPGDGGKPTNVTIWKPDPAPKYGAEFFALVESVCVGRGGPPGATRGWAGVWATEKTPPKYELDPSINGRVVWQNGELVMPTSNYTDCMVKVTHSTAHP